MAEAPYEVKRSGEDHQWQVWRVIDGRRRLVMAFPGIDAKARERAEECCKKMNAGCALGE